MGISRQYATRRQSIVDAIVESIKNINGTADYLSDLENNVEPRLKFWDEVEEFPAVHLNAGTETVLYQGGGYKDRFLAITVRCYVQGEDAVELLSRLLEDVETVLEENSGFTYIDRTGAQQSSKQTTILSIDTDEGALEPNGVGEMLIEVQY